MPASLAIGLGRATSLLAVCLCALAFPAACGGGSPSPIGADGGDGGADAGIIGWVSVDPVNDGGPACTLPASSCPATSPAAGAACGSAGLECAYIDPQNVDCRLTATCSATAGWSLAVTGANCGSPAAGCPASLEALNAAGSCTSPGKECRYNGVVCTCTQCKVTSCSYQWTCSGTSAASGCPRVPPRLAPCCPEGQRCYYGPCQSWVVHECRSGAWTRATVGHCN